MNRHSQRGSALLIVLGFLSFMVVSAVAFAIWMRNERLPSSALRRNVANRYLVKAALAQAMSRVDDAIRSHAYPGAWNTNLQNMAYRDKNNCAYDWWESRVFMPPDPEGVGTTSGDPFSRYAPVTKTVSVLNLEALGYLPPAIANDVRLLSRSSWAAQWDYFNFDAGRYAFCAVNVSDFLDISKMAADAPRTSAPAIHAQSAGQKPPSSRFSLAYLLRDSTQANNDDNFSSVNGLSQFDQFVHTSPGQGEWNTAPLVSLMDYNLSVGDQKMGRNLWSPFVDLASGFNNTRFFHEVGNVPTSSKIKGAQRQPFVTASWFPPSDDDFAKSDGTSSRPLDLSQHQPFQPGTMLAGNHNMEYTQTAENRVFWETMLNNGKAFCQMDQLTLFDYLDEDDVPLSLAMPCAERVPMITALAPDGDVSVSFTSLTPVGDPQIDTGKMEQREISEANIKITFGGMALKSTLVFPFKDGKTPVGCTVQAYGRLVFVAQQAAGGAGGAVASIPLRSNGFARNFRPLNDSEWTAAVADADQFKLEEGSSQGNLRHTQAEDCLLVTLAGQDESWTPPARMQSVENCWEDKHLRFQGVTELQKPIIRQVSVYTLVPSATPGGSPTKGPLKDTYYQILLNPFDANGNVIDVRGMCTAASPDGMPAAAFTALCAQYTINPCLVTWTRVKQEGKTVDMVPATYEDDKAFNGVDNTPLSHMPINNPLGNSNIIGDPANPSPQRAMPIMRFPGTLSFTFSDASSGTFNQQNQWVAKSCYAVDPRFNWAPENWWFDTADANPTGQKWHDAVFNDGGILDKLGQDEIGGSDRADRANDPFLFVSNLGYLQSVGELVFLPHLSDMAESGAEPNCVLGERKGASSNNGLLYDGNPREMQTSAPDQTVLASMPCALAAWKSYQSYRTNPTDGTFEFGANLYRRGLVNGAQGFYINPYTQSQEVMLAALANTPLNYWVAGTNYTAQGKAPTEFTTFNSFKNYMFGDSGSGYSRMTGKDVNKIATFLRHRFEDLASMIEIPPSMGDADRYVYQKVWEDMFDALDWGGVLDRTVEDVYNDLSDYFDGTESNNKDYQDAYQRGSGGNGYSDLNHFVRGGGKKAFGTSIRLHPDRAVHKEDFGRSADPLRGQYAGDTGDTTCWRNLHDVDRKFLHSFWRDCFGNRQQLFLIFVRAESTALGGTGEGTPAQQGGRAVALVWRDPVAPAQLDVREEDNNQYRDVRHPHKMRILFYRQLD
ncbi:MAG: hypothetical protein J6V72_13930 [Kiritimatiellae bacterium]|nr:hypothetical protein [Kiritimatiellia bacterium]